MKAIVHTRYGSPDVLEFRDVPKPTPGAREVLVKVHAATVNRTDCGVLRGKPYIVRLFTGLFGPVKQISGTDFAGVVEEVGSEVTTFKPGERVFGFNDDGLRSHAEYLVIHEGKGIASMPEGLSFTQAAASLEGAHYFYNFALKVKIDPGDNILLNGATGAIGSAGVQILKHFGARVTAVANTPNLELVRSLGADDVIDYLKEDFTRSEGQFKYIFDAVGKSSFGKCKHLLVPGGVYMSSELGPGAENVYLPLTTAITGGKRVFFPLPLNIRRSIAFIKGMIENGEFRPVIDRTYLLEQTAEAFRYVETGQKTGNVVVLCDRSSGEA